MTAIVLAGGRSTRLGRDKLEEKIGGRSLLQRVVEALLPLSREILVAVAPGARFSLAGQAKVRQVEDVRPERSSLVGIYSGLQAAQDYHSLVVAGDMPFLSPPLLRYMMEAAPGFDVVMPRVGGHLEPAHAIYSKACLIHMERLLDQGELRIFDFLPQVKVRYVEEDEVNRFDERHLSFFNVNTEADLKRARELANEVRV